MKQQFYFFVLFFLFGAISVHAQIYDLDELRKKPDSNSLKVDRPTLDVRPVDLPLSDLDLKVIYWKHWSSFGINANQAQFSENWNAGGVNSVSVGVLLNHKSDFTKNNTNFVTEIDLKYGKQKNKDQLPRKNNDRIYWDNKLALKISNHWSLYTALTFETQFDVGYNYGKGTDGRDSILTVKSNFMAPGYLTESLGLEYKPDNTFSLRFGTGTARQTFVWDEEVIPTANDGSRYGVEAGKRFRNDLGFLFQANLNRNLSPNLNLKSMYNLNCNYEEITDPIHRLEATLSASVTRLVNVTLSGIMSYNSREHEDIQYSQTLALGLMFKFPR